MSVSNLSGGRSPASKFIEWAGSVGVFQYYDKENGEESKKFMINLPETFYIVALDQLNSINGFSKADNKGIYSNEIKNMKTEPLNVRVGGGATIATGLYADIKDKAINAGGKFTKSVYAVLLDVSKGKDVIPEMELVHFKFNGSSLSPWFEAGIGDDGNIIKMGKNSEEKTNGSTKYFEPTVKKLEVREDILEQVKETDKEVQAYLTGRGSNAVPGDASSTQTWTVPEPAATQEEGTPAPTTADAPEPQFEDDDLPF